MNIVWDNGIIKHEYFREALKRVYVIMGRGEDS